MRSLSDAVGPSLLSDTDLPPGKVTRDRSPALVNLTKYFDCFNIRRKSHCIFHMVRTGVADHKVYARSLPKVTLYKHKFYFHINIIQ